MVAPSLCTGQPSPTVHSPRGSFAHFPAALSPARWGGGLALPFPARLGLLAIPHPAMSCCECTSSGNPFLAKSGWPRTSHHSQCWYWTTGTHRDAPVPAVPAQGLLCMAEEEFGMKNLLISCTGWALSSHVASRSRNGSCCPTCGSKAAAGTEVERAWFPSGAATGTAKSEGSLMRAQGGLQTHCPCPLSPVAVAQAQPCQSGPTVLGFSPTVAVWEPCWWCRGCQHVPVPSVGSPVLHHSLRVLGISQTMSPQCQGCHCGGFP